jgi:hypothetical protein
MAKARKQKLKVFKTPIGFHDAFVAAPSRKAALAAWGADVDLFSAGIAELAPDDAAGAKAALARPGEVVRVGRSGAKEDRPSKKARAKPKPSRASVTKAEAAVAELEKAQAAERSALARDEERLAKRRRALDDKHRQAKTRAEAKSEAARDRYRKAMADWG